MTSHWSPARLSDLSGKRVIVTGATSGVGFATARALARAGASAFPAYAASKLAVMLWGLELDRRLRAAGSPVTSYLTHPGFVASNLSNVSDQRAMAAFHAVVRSAANVFGNDIDAGAATTLYCITEPIPPGSYVGIDSRLGLKGSPTLSDRAAHACDYDDAARLWDFAEKETGTTLPFSSAASPTSTVRAGVVATGYDGQAGLFEDSGSRADEHGSEYDEVGSVGRSPVRF